MSDLEEAVKCPECGGVMKSLHAVWTCTLCGYKDDE